MLHGNLCPWELKFLPSPSLLFRSVHCSSPLQRRSSGILPSGEGVCSRFLNQTHIAGETAVIHLGPQRDCGEEPMEGMVTRRASVSGLSSLQIWEGKRLVHSFFLPSLLLCAHHSLCQGSCGTAGDAVVQCPAQHKVKCANCRYSYAGCAAMQFPYVYWSSGSN